MSSPDIKELPSSRRARMTGHISNWVNKDQSSSSSPYIQKSAEDGFRTIDSVSLSKSSKGKHPQISRTMESRASPFDLPKPDASRRGPPSVMGRSGPSGGPSILLQQGKQKPCFAWQKKGSCTNGDTCRYRHISMHEPLADMPVHTVQGPFPLSKGVPLSENLGSPSSSSEPRLVKPCFAWMKKGTCRNGDNCAYGHESRKPRSRPGDGKANMPPLPEIEAAHVAQLEARRAKIAKEEALEIEKDIVYDFTLVQYGSGLDIQNILTGFDACKITVSNLPASATKSQIVDLFVQQGIDSSLVCVVYIRLAANGKQIATVVCPRDAEIVAAGLEGIAFEDEHLSFKVDRLNGSQAMTHDCPERIVLTISWRLPTYSVVAKYLNHHEAEAKVAALNGGTCSGRKVKAELNSGRYSQPCEVLVKGLDPDMPHEALFDFLGVLCFRQLKCYNRHDPSLVQSHLSKILTTVQSWEPLILNTTNGWATIRTHFPSYEAATRAKQHLAGSKWICIGNADFKLNISDPWKFIVSIPSRQYEVQQEQWRSFIDSASQQKGATLKTRVLQDVHQVVVRGTDKKLVGALKVRVESLAAGQKVDTWHPYFGHLSSQTLFDDISQSNGVIIQRDRRQRVLRLFGDPSKVQLAVQLVKDEVDRLEKSQHVVHLKRQSIPYFINQGLLMLQEELGQENAILNIRSHPATITIRGGEASRHALRRVIRDSLDTVASGLRSTEDQVCPICYTGVINSVILVCGHAYCTPCFQHYLSTAADNNKFPLVCLGGEDSCTALIPLPTIRRFLTPSQFKRLLESAFDLFVASRPPEFRYCPTPDCQQVYRCSTDHAESSAIHCPSCLADICPSCHEEGHDGMTCNERRIYSDPTAQERLNEELAAASGYKRCPQCNVFIEKIDGCNHMSCRCGTHICWVCMGTYPENEIYNHMSQAHGGFHEQNMDVGQLNDYGDYLAQVAELLQWEGAEHQA